MEQWLTLNAQYAKSWPNITQKRDAPADAKAFEGVADKFRQFFDPAPGTGD
jgi:ferredoxin